MYLETEQSFENIHPIMVWMYKNKREPRNRRSNDGLDVRKQGRVEKTSIQPRFGCTKTRES
ncbi:hypothetical protein J8TS2_14740 [Lederbergia ruris]|uniref:Uncharacterized protein n=1 Tax=Lederbergia ruris TaxID=217495 RepID=A0ABQ4KGQ9_9BACI|nr:hypothetical protein J8TS2_14740 [Lederbergia ruris]